MTEPVSADDIREEIRSSLRRLRRLGDDGRIVMAEDSWNTGWHDSRVAVQLAAAALERADAALRWMHTLRLPADFDQRLRR